MGKNMKQTNTTPPLFRAFVKKESLYIIAIFLLIGLAGTLELKGAQATPLDWSDYQAQTLKNLYKHNTPERAHQLAQFYGIHDAREYCRSTKKAKTQKNFNQCINQKIKTETQITQIKKEDKALRDLLAKLSTQQ